MVYGDMLVFFNEQFLMYDYYDMQSQVVAGKSKRKFILRVKGIIQHLKKSDYSNTSNSLSEVIIPTFWTRKKLEVGKYLEIKDETYRIIKKADWVQQGGFYIYELESVIGNTDEQEPHEYVDLGQASYG